MKKLTLLLTLFTATALFACLQASPVAEISQDGIHQAAHHTTTSATQTPKKEKSSGVTVIIWP